MIAQETGAPSVSTRGRSAPLAVLFPGQGSQVAGMAKDVAESVEAASEVFDLASEALGIDARALCWSASNAELKRTENAQPALVISSLACWSAFASLTDPADPELSVFAGHSLGALCAAAAAGVISYRDGALPPDLGHGV